MRAFGLLLLSCACGLIFGAEKLQLREVLLSTDRTIDATSPESIVKGVIKRGMSEQQKAYALFRYFTQRNVHKQCPPFEDYGNPAELMTKYAYCLCGTLAHNYAELATVAGLPAAPVGIQGHVVAQAQYWGGWHIFDVDMMNFYADANGVVMPLSEISKLAAAGKHSLPPLASYPFYESSAPVTELFVGQAPKSPILRREWKWKYDLHLRPGAELTWSWYGDPDVGFACVTHIITCKDGGVFPDPRNVRKHKTISEYLADDWDYYTGRSGKPKWHWGYRRGGLNTNSQQDWHGNAGNGRLTLDLGRNGFKNALNLFDSAENIEVKAGKLVLKDPAQDGSFVLNFSLPYVYADGWIEKPLPEKNIKIELTLDGRTWKQVYPTGGVDDGKRIRLFESVRGEPKFWLKTTLAAGAEPLSAFKAVGVFHHAFVSLPGLVKGKNLVRLRLENPEALASVPFEVTFVYDQVADDRRIMRQEQVVSFTSRVLEQSIDVGDKHWPLMREIRISCARGGHYTKAPPVLEEQEELDWAAMPFDRTYHGVHFWDDFERGDRGRWRAKLTTRNTYAGSDFSLDNWLIAQDGQRQLKMIRCGGFLNRDTHFRCMLYLKNVPRLKFYSGCREDGVYYEKIVDGLKQGEWQTFQVDFSELLDPKDPTKKLKNPCFMNNLYLLALEPGESPEFTIDNAILFDGDLKHDPFLDPDAPRNALADDPIWNAKPK